MDGESCVCDRSLCGFELVSCSAFTPFPSTLFTINDSLPTGSCPNDAVELRYVEPAEGLPIDEAAVSVSKMSLDRFS